MSEMVGWLVGLFVLFTHVCMYVCMSKKKKGGKKRSAQDAL